MSETAIEGTSPYASNTHYTITPMVVPGHGATVVLAHQGVRLPLTPGESADLASHLLRAGIAAMQQEEHANATHRQPNHPIALDRRNTARTSARECSPS